MVFSTIFEHSGGPKPARVGFRDGWAQHAKMKEIKLALELPKPKPKDAAYLGEKKLWP